MLRWPFPLRHGAENCRTRVVTRVTRIHIQSYADRVIETQSSDGRVARGERILDAAAELLLRYGYARVTIDDVAQRAEVGKGTVYLHWRTREELFGAVLGRELAQALDEVAEGIVVHPGSWQVHRLARDLFLALGRRPLLVALVRSDPEVLGKFASRHSAERARRGAIPLGEYLGLLSAHGMLRDDLSADDLALAFIAVWMGFVLFEPVGEQDAGGSVLTDSGDALERRADLLAATVQAAFGSGRVVTDDDDVAMRVQVADWLRRVAGGDRAGLSAEAGAEPPNKGA
jgi:AcrR family transcriptional regulator